MDLQINLSSKLKHELNFYFGKSCLIKVQIIDSTNNKYVHLFEMTPDIGEKEFMAGLQGVLSKCKGTPTNIYIPKISLT